VSIPDSYPVLAAYFGSLLIRARFIVDVRDPQEEILSNKYRRGFGGFIVKIYKYIVYRIYRKSMKLFCVTRMIAHILANKIGAGAKYIYIIPNGADLRIFKPIDKNEARGRFGLSQDVVLVAYIGPLASWAYYNLVPVLLAIRKVREKLNINIKIMVAGRCYSESFKKIIGRFKDILEYMGELETKDVVILLSACDIGIIPRIEDPIYDYAIPVKFYEYVATGLPIIVIARKQSELAEIVEKNKLGILCEPQDHICLEKAIETLAMNKGLIGEFRKNVLTFRKYIDRRIGAERLFKLIVELMQNDRFDA
jgi:glycosyltransferase involved in cell wall biosynthesis